MVAERVLSVTALRGDRVQSYRWRSLRGCRQGGSVVATLATDLPRVLSSVVVVQQDDSDWFLVNLERGDSVAV